MLIGRQDGLSSAGGFKEAGKQREIGVSDSTSISGQMGKDVSQSVTDSSDLTRTFVTSRRCCCSNCGSHHLSEAAGCAAAVHVSVTVILRHTFFWYQAHAGTTPLPRCGLPSLRAQFCRGAAAEMNVSRCSSSEAAQQRRRPLSEPASAADSGGPQLIPHSHPRAPWQERGARGERARPAAGQTLPALLAPSCPNSPSCFSRTTHLSILNSYCH